MGKNFASLFLLITAACGGPKDSPPGPLSKHFDDMYIAAVPLEQKQQVVQTQNDWSLAKMENAKAEADIQSVNTLLDVSHNDQKAAHLAYDSANSQMKDAEKSADMNRINQSKKDLHTAEDMIKAADARTAYLDAYKSYLSRQLRYAQENMYAKEAAYELAKSQLGQKNNIAPKGIVYADFPSQADERAKRVGGAKDKAEGEKHHALDMRDAWMRAQKQADSENGKQTNLPDPMGAPTAAGGAPPAPQP
jgi:hypothetical protein